ncbi:hypothetical protein AJ80_01069 [Polytolypa hystricis UAMH7299]|uniref:GED domain-containing protein n=1 Tax=Polytolypa hystricis (strain UAMH7299) TaxID=1447883 RepID=A0A2B7Z1K1_POLH7|nr:hypothetical protein AJ80_01069 [Polytolypa hystricis UAMH7299]
MLDEVDPLSLKLLHSKVQADLLDKIDELSTLGLHRRVVLPQLVLCGDQNSGKTLVFEAITGVSLPANHGLCTRFATEVVLRRSREVSASVKIRPGPNASPDYRHKLGVFARTHNWLRDIPKLFSEARLIMGLSQDGRYSQDVLQLEISGPTLPNLSVVDLPGLIKAPGDNQTLEDVGVARKITESYMNNPQNIMLAVASAEHPLSQQVVLHMIKSCSPRTMGIITKPDALRPGSSIEETFYARVKNQDTPLRLGWHVLRNADSYQRSSRDFERDDMEHLFFSTTLPWKMLSSTAMGIDSLRNRLNKILLGQIESHLATLSSDIRKELEMSRTLLSKLGPSRTSTGEQRVYLTGVAEKFQLLSRSAVLGEYNNDFFRYHPQTSLRRLRSVVRNWAEEFAEDMEVRGHSYHIYDDSTSGTPNVPPSNPSPDDPQPVARSTFINGLSELLKQSKGRELRGLVNSQVVGELFIRYSLKWATMARAHVFEIWKKVKQFLDDLLHHVAGVTVGEAIIRELLDYDMGEKLEKLYEKIDELLAPYKRVMPSTLNRKLTAKINRLRARSSAQYPENEQGDEHDLAVCSDLLDCMQEYYSIALSVFIDNVAGLAIENCLVEGLDEMLSPSKVARMSDADLELLVADSEDVELSRSQLSRKVRVLGEAMSSCRRCEMLALESTSQLYREPSQVARESLATTVTSTTTTTTSSSASRTSRFPDSDTEISVSPSSPKLANDIPTNILRSFPTPGQPDHDHPSTPLEQIESMSEPGSPMIEKLTPPPKSPARTMSVSTDGSRKESTRSMFSKSLGRKKISKKQSVISEDKRARWSPSPVPSTNTTSTSNSASTSSPHPSKMPTKVVTFTHLPLAMGVVATR